MRKTPRMACHIVKLLTDDCACFPVGLLIGVQSSLFICQYRSSCLPAIGDEQCQLDTMLSALTGREKQFSFPLLKLRRQQAHQAPIDSVPDKLKEISNFSTIPFTPFIFKWVFQQIRHFTQSRTRICPKSNYVLTHFAA